MKSSRTSGLVLAGVVGLTGLGIGAALRPTAASAATSSTTQAVTTRLTALKNALASLVKDGTLTQAQADKVATTLDSALPERGFGHGGHRGVDLDTAAGVLGMTTDQLRTALDGGKTLAQVAQGKGVSQATLVDKLVAAEKLQIAAAVKAGRLTQAQADAMTADLKARITERVTSARPAGGHGGHGDGDGDGPRRGGPGGATTPTSPEASPSLSSSTT
jgi:hypothetical protein